MIIKKYNENKISISDKELSTFIEMIIDKFYPDRYLQNMGSYESIIHEGFTIYCKFYFMVIMESELKIMQNILEYIRKFENVFSDMFIRKYENMVECVIYFNKRSYDKIFDDLKREEDAKKYNL